MAIKFYDVITWGKIIRQSGMSGVAAMIAGNSELKSYDDEKNCAVLEIHRSQKNIVETRGMADMCYYLAICFGEGVKIDVIYGDAINSPAMISRERRLSKVEASLRNVSSDDFLKSTNEQFGAKVIMESIK